MVVDSKFMNLDPSRTYYENLRDENKSINQSRMTLEPLVYDLENTTKKNDFNDLNSCQVTQNKSLYEQYQLQATEESLYSKINTKEMSTNLQKSARNFNNQTTPLYTKNPNMSNNKIYESRNLSRNMYMDCIEPSPSGITRCYVKFDEPLPAQKEEPPKPVIDYVQVKYQNPTNYKPYDVKEISHTRDMSTSPFVFLKSQTNENKPNDLVKLNAPKNVEFLDAATQFNETQKQFNEAAVQNTPVVSKKNESMSKSVQLSAMQSVIVSEEQSAPKMKEIDRQQVEEVVHKSKQKLGKSKVIFVNLTPKPSNQNESVRQDISNLGLIDNCEPLNTTVIGGDEMLLTTNVTNNSYQQKLDDSTTSFDKYPNSAKQQSQRLMTITEESDNQLMDSNGINNQKTSYYYDNIIKSKVEPIHDTTEVNQEIFTPAISKDHTQNNHLDIDQQNQNFNDIIQNNPNEHCLQTDEFDNSRQMNHVREIEQKHQIMQFPTPNEDNYDLKNFEKLQVAKLKRYNIDSLDITDNISTKGPKTFYDGKKLWTLNDYQNGLNQWYKAEENDQRPDNNAQNNDDLDNQIKKKNNLHVQIQLPPKTLNETNMNKPKPVKKRKCQMCCCKLFIFFVIFLVVVLFTFFIGFDDYARKTFFNKEFWQSFKFPDNVDI